MDYVRTPDARFSEVPDFACPPRYVDVPAGDGTTLRMAYVDEGARAAPVVVMLHGEPSWGFLYRTVLRACVAGGLRVVVPDVQALERLIIDKLTPISVIANIRSSFALKQVKYETALPLRPWAPHAS